MACDWLVQLVEHLLQVFVDGGAQQQRVIDVLNALSGVGITKVTFTDLVD